MGSAASPAQEARGPVRGRKRSSTQYKQSVSEAARSAPGAGEKAAASSRSPSRSRSNAGSAASQQPQGRSSTSPSQGANEELAEAAYRKSSAATSDISGHLRERSDTVAGQCDSRKNSAASDEEATRQACQAKKIQEHREWMRNKPPRGFSRSSRRYQDWLSQRPQ